MKYSQQNASSQLNISSQMNTDRPENSQVTKILFVCHGNMFRDIPIGLNEYVNEKCKKSTEKS